MTFRRASANRRRPRAGPSRRAASARAAPADRRARSARWAPARALGQLAPGGLGSGSGSGSGVGGSSAASSGASKFGSAGSLLQRSERLAVRAPARTRRSARTAAYKFAVDDAKNAIVVMATPEDYKRLLKVVRDARRTAQSGVHRGDHRRSVAERRSQFRRALVPAEERVDAAPSRTATPARRRPMTHVGNNILGAAVGAAFPGFAYALRAANTQVTLSALNKITNVNIISTPSLTVLDNRQAVLQVGDQVPVTTLRGANTHGRRDDIQLRQLPRHRRHSGDHAAYQRERPRDARARAGGLQCRAGNERDLDDADDPAAARQDAGRRQRRRNP